MQFPWRISTENAADTGNDENNRNDNNNDQNGISNGKTSEASESSGGSESVVVDAKKFCLPQKISGEGWPQCLWTNAHDRLLRHRGKLMPRRMARSVCVAAVIKFGVDGERRRPDRGRRRS